MQGARSGAPRCPHVYSHRLQWLLSAVMLAPELSSFEGWCVAPAGVSRWIQAYLQHALHEAVLCGSEAHGTETREAVFFADVDYSSAEGRATLPEAGAVYTPAMAWSFFDNSKDGSPLVPFAETSSSMVAFIRAAVVSRRAAEHAVTSQRGFAALVSPKADHEDDAGGAKRSGAGRKRRASKAVDDICEAT